MTPEALASYEFHHDLTSFRPPAKQHKALIEIAKLPEGRIIIARRGEVIVGYVTFLYPDPLERWSEGNMENLLELGAIEVIPEFRGFGVGKNFIDRLDDGRRHGRLYHHYNRILLALGFKTARGLNVWEYRKVMEKMMNAGGLVWYATDDPEICSRSGELPHGPHWQTGRRRIDSTVRPASV